MGGVVKVKGEGVMFESSCFKIVICTSAPYLYRLPILLIHP